MSDQGLSCPLCIEFASTEKNDWFVVLAACGHSFHRSCLKSYQRNGYRLCPVDVTKRIDNTEWIKINGVDPTIRRPLTRFVGPPDYTFKIVVLGGPHVGKSTLIHRYTADIFDPRSITSTIGVGKSWFSRRIHIDGKSIKLNFCDTGGEEKYRAVAQNFARNAHGALLVYSYVKDVTQSKSLEQIPYWMDFLKSSGVTASEAAMVLVGNKVDVPVEERGITSKQGHDFAKECGLSLYETSATDNLNVNVAFQALVMEILTKIESNSLSYITDEERAADGQFQLGGERNNGDSVGKKFCKTFSQFKTKFC